VLGTTNLFAIIIVIEKHKRNIDIRALRALHAKLKKITPRQASICIATLGIITYFSGLRNPFQGDDTAQIVDNPVVHSLNNFSLLFRSGTLYTGNSTRPLGGTFYRPLMTMFYSILYGLFGPHTIAYHVFQLIVFIGSAVLLYLFFRFSFRSTIALFLAAVYLVHPINSQAVYAIPSLQDSLFVFFGLLAMYLLVKYKTTKSLVYVALCLFLSLLSKETGGIFIVMALIYLYWFNRPRLYKFVAFLVVPIVMYFVLRVPAVGLSRNPNIAPIDRLNLAGRMFTAPSVVQFYFTKFILPWKLASGYQWTYSKFSVQHVLVPLIVDCAIVALVLYVARKLRKNTTKALYFTYIFFALWTLVGLIPYLQILPLDATANETWFYSSMVGLLGMFGVLLTVYPIKMRAERLMIFAFLLIALLGIRSGLRGHDWSNEQTLAYKDIAASKQDFLAYNDVSDMLIQQGRYNAAEPYVQQSIAVYPAYFNYNNLAAILTHQSDYAGAVTDYDQALKYGNYQIPAVYENIAQITLVYGNYEADQQYIVDYALAHYPDDPNIWMDLAILDYEHGDGPDAKVAIERASTYGQVPSFIYNSIVENHRLIISFPSLGKTIAIPPSK
jgi:hypothetical protein